MSKMPALSLAALFMSVSAMAAADANLAGEQRVVRALSVALENADFPQCRIAIEDNFWLHIRHGYLRASIDLFGQSVKRSTDGQSLTVSGQPDLYCEDGFYEDTYVFVLSPDQKRISQVLYKRSQVRHVNRGTIFKPIYGEVKTEVESFSCEAD